VLLDFGIVQALQCILHIPLVRILDHTKFLASVHPHISVSNITTLTGEVLQVLPTDTLVHALHVDAEAAPTAARGAARVTTTVTTGTTGTPPFGVLHDDAATKELVAVTVSHSILSVALILELHEREAILDVNALNGPEFVEAVVEVTLLAAR